MDVNARGYSARPRRERTGLFSILIAQRGLERRSAEVAPYPVSLSPCLLIPHPSSLSPLHSYGSPNGVGVIVYYETGSEHIRQVFDNRRRRTLPFAALRADDLAIGERRS